MATKTVILCDLDAKEGAETHVYMVDGEYKALDLCEADAAKLTKALEPFDKAGREITAAEARKLVGNGGGIELDTKTIRTWAAENGVDCPSKGRIPQAIVEAYIKAHPADPTD